jgi:photosystem II stability/assembly factor-like uncharacterized protein
VGKRRWTHLAKTDTRLITLVIGLILVVNTNPFAQTPSWHVVKQLSKVRQSVLYLDAPAKQQPTWTWRYPVVRSIYFLDSRTGWAVGDGGVAVRTVDGGNHWSSALIQPSANLLSVFFHDRKNGWIAGYSEGKKMAVVFKTDDGGVSWHIQKLFERSQFLSPRGLYFLGEQHGYLVGGKEDSATGRTDELILATNDGGKTWEQQYSALSDAPLTGVTFVDESKGWVIGKEKILHSEDGGNDWIEQRPTNPEWIDDFFGLAFISSSEGWIVGGRGSAEVLHTTDSGRTWKSQVLPIKKSPSDSSKELLCFSTQFASASRGIVGCGGGIALATTNGGADWSVERTGRPGTLLTVAVTPGAAFAGDSQGAILKRSW